ncbi:MAG TPA: hypothetical protein DCL63_00035 [Firmicutes bacterium]|nr:hypothetical protein [Bacillota bacterium]HBK61882.1 hypothetical protein [Bacillota bacterium]
MKNRQLWARMLIALITLALVCAAGSVEADAKKAAKGKGPKPPKERKVDAAVTKRPTELRTEDGIVVMNLPEGVTFASAEHRGKAVWVHGPSGQRYWLPIEDVKMIKGHKASVEDISDSQLKSFGLQVTAARVAAVMQSVHPAPGTTLPSSNRTVWEDKVLIEMSIKAQIGLPQMSLMLEWAVFLGYAD